VSRSGFYCETLHAVGNDKKFLQLVVGQIFIVTAANNHPYYLLDLELVLCAYEFRILFAKGSQRGCN